MNSQATVEALVSASALLTRSRRRAQTAAALAQFRGQPVILVFFPDDWSPVCAGRPCAPTGPSTRLWPARCCSRRGMRPTT